MPSYTFLIPKNILLSDYIDNLVITRDSGLFWLYGDNMFHLKGFESHSNTLICTAKRGVKIKFLNIRSTKVVRFSSILDFSSFFHPKRTSIPISNLDFNSLNSIEEGLKCLSNSPAEPFLQFPPMVSKVYIPTPVTTIPFHKSTEKSTSSRSDRKFNDWCITFDSPLPSRPILRDDVDKDTYTALKLLFDQRPAWTKLGILNINESVDASKLKKILPYVAYTFLNGPWRNVWIRYDLDPRLNSLFKDYQIIEFRNVYNVDSTRKNRKWDRTFRSKTPTKTAINERPILHIFDGKSSSRNFYQYQLCDITFGPVTDFLDSLSNKLRVSPNEIDGWYPEQTVSTVRELIKNQMEALLKTEGNLFSDETFDGIQNGPLIIENNLDDDEYDLWDF
jgi:hypothetical protein